MECVIEEKKGKTLEADMSGSKIYSFNIHTVNHSISKDRRDIRDVVDVLLDL